MKNKQNFLEGLAKQGTLPVDNIPAQLTENEYVIPADVVVALGKGNAESGVQFLDNLVEEIRQKTQSMLSKVMEQ
jgi:polyhydroxyalkanoate synthesis regulator phasin